MHLDRPLGHWATRGVTVCTSAFVACQRCCRAGSSLAWGLESADFSMWHFLKLVAMGFLPVLQFPPLLDQLMIQPMK